MEIRTDLALERREMRGAGVIDGVISTEKRGENCRTTEIAITNENGAAALGKPMGRYITVEAEDLTDPAALTDGRFSALTAALASLVPETGDILVAGLGNPDITSDSLGPVSASMVFATRHIPPDTAREYRMPALRRVSVLVPGVAGKTGAEPCEVLAGAVGTIRPAAVIAVDALAAGSVSRLASTVQLCDTGIEPGSGVGNRRKGINEKTLGVPVIAIGVPTVVDVLSLSEDISGREATEKARRKYASMMVTPKDTDLVTRSAAKLIARAVNCVLQKNLTPEELSWLSG